jgi:RHS repeat-associated protein
VWTQRLTFSYDGVGLRTKVQDSKSGVTTSVFDAANNLVTQLYGGTAQTAMRMDLTYNADNQIASLTQYSDLTASTKVSYGTYTYDVVGRLSNLHTRKGSDDSNIANFTYTYDPASRVKTEVANGTTTSYAYDNANQLTGDGTNTVTFDATGNRNNGSNTPGTGNQLASDATWTYSYDNEGNETKKSQGASATTWKYAYDNKDELTQAQKWSEDPDIPGTAVLQVEVDYKYDVWGNLVERDDDDDGSGSDPSVATRYSLDGWNPALVGGTGLSNFNVWGELDVSNNLLTRYFHGDQVDQLFGRQDSGTQYWYLTDHLGSVRYVLDNNGATKDALNYDGWGNILAGETNSTFRGNYAWTGRLFDVETQLQYNRARWYDPSTGRWQSQDPLGIGAGDSNLYRGSSD